jgi:DNA-binding GntR family transcriptional regulator
MSTVGSTSIGESKQLLAEEVFHHIGKQIVECTLVAGDRIRDVDVAEELHVSRTPVREALQRLERLGMVTMYPSRYTEVTEVSAETVAQSLEFAGHQAGIAARLAVPRITSAQRAHVIGLIAKMSAAIDDSVKTSDARWAVFSYLGARTGNAQHRALIDDASMVVLRNLRGWAVPQADRERMQGVYRDFRVAVRDRDGDEAERLTRAMYYV